MDIQLDRILAALEKSWSAATSVDSEWTQDNPTLGQCAVTALVLQDYFGGDLMRGVTPSGSHYFNRFPDGEIVDLTFSQFPEGTEVTEVETRGRDYVVGNHDTRTRYKVLRQRVQNELVK